MALNSTNNAASLYTNPNSTQFQDSGLNAFPSLYADLYGQPKTDLIREDLRNTIFNSAPRGFEDLQIMNMQAPEQRNDTEFSWSEMGWGRDAVIATAASVGGGSQIVITTTPAAMQVVTINTLVGFPNGQIGNIIALNKSLSQITVLMPTGVLAPSVAVNDIINNVSSIEPAGVNNYSQNFRAQTIKRTNFIQRFVKGMTFDDDELLKYQRSGTTDYLTMNQRSFMTQFRTDISNTYWNGRLGQIQMSYGKPAKMADGILSLMQKAGSPTEYTTISAVGSALASVALDTEFGDYGQVKYAYMTPTMKYYVAQYFKFSETRYNVMTGDTTASAGGTVAPLSLDFVDIGSTRIVIVPYQRFQDIASFQVSMQNTIVLVDQKNIIPQYFRAEGMIQTPTRDSGINLNTFTNYVMYADFSIAFNNPQSSGLIIAN